MPPDNFEDHVEAQTDAPATVHLHVDRTLLSQVVQNVLTETLTLLDWPAGRIALDEAEAAAACGVGRHVLRDLRLAGKFPARRLGKKYVYTRSDLLTALESGAVR